MNYYNEWDPYAAQWLRNLIEAGHLPVGDVDERSIADVSADDVRHYTHCHFFAGIGGWPLALQLAGWPADRPVWTGSCPCQPFSAAGKRAGADDPRHLWPTWWSLIRECRPAVIFGEQVGGADALAWFDLVCADLEGGDYAVGASDLPAACVGAPHRRQRLWFVANAMRERRQACRGADRADDRAKPAADCALGSAMEHADGERRQARRSAPSIARQGDTATSAGWDDCEWLPFTDGVARPTQPGVHPLAHGVPARVGKLRAYGNAIVPQVAASFIASYMECAP